MRDRKIKKKISSYLDGQLSGFERFDVENRIMISEVCKKEADELIELQEQIKRALPRNPALDRTAENVLERIRGERLSPKSSRRAGIINTAMGGVFIRPSGADKGVAATAGMNLDFGDTVHTNELGRAYIIMEDGTELWVDKNTNVEMSPNYSARWMRMTSGGLLAFVKKSGHSHQLQTPAGYVEVLGTAYEARVSLDQRTTVTVMRGAVRLGNDLGDTVIPSGSQAFVRPDHVPSKAKVVDIMPMLNWTEEIIFRTVEAAQRIPFREKLKWQRTNAFSRPKPLPQLHWFKHAMTVMMILVALGAGWIMLNALLGFLNAPLKWNQEYAFGPSDQPVQVTFFSVPPMDLGEEILDVRPDLLRPDLGTRMIIRSRGGMYGLQRALYFAHFQDEKNAHFEDVVLDPGVGKRSYIFDLRFYVNEDNSRILNLMSRQYGLAFVEENREVTIYKPHCVNEEKLLLLKPDSLSEKSQILYEHPVAIDGSRFPTTMVARNIAVSQIIDRLNKVFLQEYEDGVSRIRWLRLTDMDTWDLPDYPVSVKFTLGENFTQIEQRVNEYLGIELIPQKMVVKTLRVKNKIL